MSMNERDGDARPAPGDAATDPEREALRRAVAPCGLDCGRCLSNPESPIATLARDLRRELGGFAAMAERFAGMDPAFAQYPGFAAVLDRLADADCSGCRDGRCLLTSCGVKDCAPAHGVDWCCECPEFPCEKSNLPPMLRQRWRRNTERIRELGPAAWLDAIRKKPRYE